MKKLLPILWTSTLLISLQGCSSQGFLGSQLFSQQEKEIPLKALEELTTPSHLKVLWKVQTKHISPNSKIHPYLSNNAIIVGGGRSISAWDKKTGKSLWQKNLGEIVSGGINGGSGTLFLGTDKGNALAINEQTGKTLWIKPLNAEILSVSASKNGRTVFRTIDGKLHGLDTHTGEIIWQQQQLTPVLSLYGASIPILVGPFVIAGFDNGKLAAYQLQKGTLIWEATLTLPRGDNELDRMVDVDGKLKAIGNAMFASSFHGRLSGVDLKTGNLYWAKKFSSYTGADVDQKGLYAADEKGNVWKFDPQTGEPFWKMDDLVRRAPTAPTLVNSNLITLGDKQGNLHFIDTRNGKFTAHVKGDSEGYIVPSKTDGGRVYSIGRGGLLTVITTR